MYMGGFWGHKIVGELEIKMENNKISTINKIAENLLILSRLYLVVVDG